MSNCLLKIEAPNCETAPYPQATGHKPHMMDYHFNIEKHEY
jgi:hypothetical protein